MGKSLIQLKNHEIIESHEDAFREQTGRYRGPFKTLCGDDALYVDLSTVPMLDSKGKVVGGIAIVNDITEEITAKEKMVRNAYYDMLTDIPNRTLLMDSINSLIINDALKTQFAALLFIDIDDFRKVNETYGHDIGDTVLKQAAFAIGKIIGGHEMFARIGGDKFVIMLPALGTEENFAEDTAREYALNIKNGFREPLNTAGEDYHLSLSIGITLFDDTEISAFDVLKRAETAMYEAKKSGRNSIVFYQSEMSIFALEQLTIRNDIHKALENEEFSVYYQPQLDVQTNKVIGAEALVRWFHPEKGYISPEKFIIVAEESGLIVKLEEWIFNRVLSDIKALSERIENFPLHHIAINVSTLHFLQPHFVEKFILLVQKHQVDPRWVELELTESGIMGSMQEAVKRIEELKKFGISFSIDDFGTGYSSFAYLKQLPADMIKIDQTFILNMDQNQGDKMIVESVVAIGQKFDMKVLAEGVENREILEYLRQNKCDFYQGYYAYKPMPKDKFEQLLATSV